MSIVEDRKIYVSVFDNLKGIKNKCNRDLSTYLPSNSLDRCLLFSSSSSSGNLLLQV